jgi:hypothetical protein
LCDHQTA